MSCHQHKLSLMCYTISTCHVISTSYLLSNNSHVISTSYLLSNNILVISTSYLLSNNYTLGKNVLKFCKLCAKNNKNMWEKMR